MDIVYIAAAAALFAAAVALAVGCERLQRHEVKR